MHVVEEPARSLARASQDLRFGAAVALFGMLLRDSPYRGDADYELVQELARGALGRDESGYRAEFIRLVALARDLGAVETGG
jgi:Ca-activated chloride channel family protein